MNNKLETLHKIIEELKLKTVKQYANDNGISVQSVYQGKKIIDILGYKFVIDN